MRVDPVVDPEVERQLRDQLHRAVLQLAAAGPGPQVAHAHLGRRLRRQRLVTGMVAVLVLVVAGLVATQLGTPTEGVILDGRPALPLDLEWSSSAGGVQRPRTVTASPDGTLFALAPPPGIGPEDAAPDGSIPLAVHRSADGVTWAATTIEALHPSYTIAAGADVLYSLSTAPAGAEGPPGIATSTDGGLTWSPTALPAPPLPTLTVAAMPYATLAGLAAGADRAVAFVRTSVYPDLHPDPGGLSQGMTAAGVETVDLQACVAANTTTTEQRPDCSAYVRGLEPWTAYGIESAFDLVSQRLYVQDGTGWVEASDGIDEGIIRGVTATGDGFAAVAGGRHPFADAVDPFAVWTSSDGRVWAQAATLPDTIEEVVDLGAVEGRAVVVGLPAGPDLVVEPATGAVVSWQQPDGSFAHTQVADLVEGGSAYVRHADVGPLGVAVVIDVASTVDPATVDLPSDVPLSQPLSQPLTATRLLLATSRDGVTWSVEDLRPHVADADIVDVEWLVVGLDRVVLGIHTATPRLTQDDGRLVRGRDLSQASDRVLVGVPGP